MKTQTNFVFEPKYNLNLVINRVSYVNTFKTLLELHLVCCIDVVATITGKSILLSTGISAVLT